MKKNCTQTYIGRSNFTPHLNQDVISRAYLIILKERSCPCILFIDKLTYLCNIWSFCFIRLQWHISISWNFFHRTHSFSPCSCVLIVKIVNNLICLFDRYLTWWHHLSKLLWLVNVDALVIVRGACNAMSMHFTHHRDHAENVRLAHAR